MLGTFFFLDNNVSLRHKLNIYHKYLKFLVEVSFIAACLTKMKMTFLAMERTLILCRKHAITISTEISDLYWRSIMVLNEIVTVLTSCHRLLQ